jgi:16S rRNA (guanine527-N7)-methyltransferase
MVNKVMIKIMQYCWMLVTLIFICWHHDDCHSIFSECGSRGGGFVFAAYFSNQNIHRLSRFEMKVPFRSSGVDQQFATNTQNILQQHNQPSFFRTLLSSVSDSDDIDISVENIHASDNDKDIIPGVCGSSTTIAASSLLSPLIEPTSDTAKELCMNTLHLTQKQFQQILHFVTLIIEWNERINLISRKDCTPSTIFTRHVLPSLVGGRIIQEQLLQQLDPNQEIRMIDVGTGGGFPGIPLAIQYPHIQFVLADSISKKIVAVQDMIETLQLSNANTYNGRVEEYFSSAATTTTKEGDIPKFDIVTGRSVTALPQFCSWIKDLAKQDSGHLVYWIGGSIDEMIQEQMVTNISIQEHLSATASSLNAWNDNFDKRVLIVPAPGVRTIAASIPETQFQQQLSKSATATRRLKTASSTSSSLRSRNNNSDTRSTGNKLAKGEWRKRNDPDQPKQRGYENFQRYTSSVVSKPDPKSKSDTQSGPILPNE